MIDNKIIPFNDHPDRELIERIEQLMANPPEGSVVLKITPDVARHILKHWHGTHNRREKPGNIKRYQGDMATGGWRLNGSTIVFTDRHLLGDGQNRLIACIRADMPFITDVRFGIDHEVFDTMDQGRMRNPDDILHIEGVPDSRNVWQAVRWAELLETNKVRLRTTFRPTEILRLYRNKHKAVGDFMPEARRIARFNRQPVGLVAAMLYTFDKVDPDFIVEFTEAWAVGAGEPRFVPLKKMQEGLNKLSNAGSGRIHDVVRAAMIINAWNACRAGKQGKGTILWDLQQAFPAIR